ncbi:hemerythrin [Proteiniborus ethanoligenes]|uniref:Hemerythrin n=1 Tax=Proteiniborus ethanoligenes TaxID=415015 RepID=A0A1H3KU96_9FIRM|nr:hemerythrin family protein [Proteiniborus ethanoligenes]SDY55787.1 hemerythrin [Proteiniborus ethanoligenes]
MWKERYKIGVELIDEQHQELFKRLSEFIRTVQNNITWDEKLDKVKETMVFMQDYVVVHFDAEEAYQEKIQYPNIEKHKEIHAKFKEEINNYVKLFESEGFTEETVKEFSAKLMTWLIMHVGKMDQEIGEYVKGKGGEI